MENEIMNLLANLNSPTIEKLSCNNDRPDQIQFRIGDQNGPQIHFGPNNLGSYTISIRDEKGQTFEHSFSINDELFEYCQNINLKIRQLSDNPAYNNYKEEKASIMLTNLISLIRPISVKIL